MVGGSDITLNRNKGSALKDYTPLKNKDNTQTMVI